MNLTDDIVLEFKNGYFEVQHVKVAEDSGNPYLSDKKTFATQSHLEKYLTPYDVPQGVLEKTMQAAKTERGIKDAKAAIVAKEKFGRLSK